MPRLTVVLPVYNHAAYLAEALDSILTQDYRDFEIIAVNDGSTDASQDVLEGYGGRVRILQASHKGPAAARNLAIGASASEFVAFMDADDRCLPNRLSLQLGAMESERLDLVASELTFIDAAGEPLPGTWSCPPHARRCYWGALLERNWIGTPSVIVRREALDEAGLFDEEFTHSEDYDLWLRLGQSFRIGYVDSALVQCRRHSLNTSVNVEAHQAFERRALRKVAPLDARLAFAELYPGPAERDQAWIWFLLRSGNPAFEVEVQRALRDYPDSRELQFSLGVFLFDTGRYQEARAMFAKMQTGDPAAINNFAVACAALGDLITARESLSEAIRLRPDYHDAHQNITAIERRQNLRLTRRPFRSNLVPMIS